MVEVLLNTLETQIELVDASLKPLFVLVHLLFLFFLSSQLGYFVLQPLDLCFHLGFRQTSWCLSFGGSLLLGFGLLFSDISLLMGLVDLGLSSVGMASIGLPSIGLCSVGISNLDSLLDLINFLLLILCLILEHLLIVMSEL